MLTGLFSLSNEWQTHMVRKLFGATRWNQYVANWPIVLAALRELWEMGRVSELKTPFCEPPQKQKIL